MAPLLTALFIYLTQKSSQTTTYFMKQLILIGFFALLFLGCSKDKDTPAPAALIDSYANRYMVHRSYGLLYTYRLVHTLEYQNGKVQKRLGVNECMLNGSCQDLATVIDEVRYGSNTISIANKSSRDDGGVLLQEWFFSLKNPDQPAYLIHKAENRTMYDSLAYSYHSNGKLSRIIEYAVYRDKVEVSVNKDRIKDFFFDASGNLKKVETRHLLDDELVIRMVTETFGDYDAAQNPIQGLFMFDDTFYRSLSKNNFRAYSKEERYMPNGDLYNSEGKNWVLEYSANNVPLFNKP